MPDFREHIVTSVEALERIYGEPYGPSIAKETDRITPQYGAFIEAAPFFALATAGPDGLDCSPRGDAPGFVRIHDEKTLLVPDRRGNNRIDSLRNMLSDPRVALLFLIPGCGETIRVNGRAAISTASSTSARRRSCARSCGIRRATWTARACQATARFSPS